jgi:hypothetical protein
MSDARRQRPMEHLARRNREAAKQKSESICVDLSFQVDLIILNRFLMENIAFSRHLQAD